MALPLPPLFLLAHGAALFFAGTHAKVVSLVFLAAAPLLAGLVCAWRGWRDRRMEGWAALALAMLLWSLAMVANIIGTLLAAASSVGAATMLLFVLYGVPLLFSVASPEGEARLVRLVDAVLAAALGYLFFVYTFAFATIADASDEGVLSLRLMFDIENAFILLFALARWHASPDAESRRFFATLVLYGAPYMATAFYINHYQMEVDYGGTMDLLIDLPFLLLAAIVLRGVPAAAQAPAVPQRLERAVRAGSPLMLPAMLMMVSSLLVFQHPALAIIGFIAATLGYGVRNVLVQMRSFDEQDKLAHLSLVDALTGLPNRRRFDERLTDEWARVADGGPGLALLMIDIDHFKLLNDGLGHPMGDARLRAVAAALRGSLRRGGDLVARYGGEEFAAILPATSLADAAAMAEAMRAAVERLALSTPAPAGVVTISIGVGHGNPAQGMTAETLVTLADAALYDAKQRGRNQVAVRRTPLPPPQLRVAATPQ
ncbi:GGDEF domain-containing protein [Flavisphingomonas formosensis]|uniref:GGDEF domain-containing protein n=1 Tax=Flavisphingomonas formosensis TaxID=861534 RepID=UPI001E4CBDD7|nr:diguanylate cyclase [Sphingomonas formosensis]